jgi:predicted nucleic acid-binding protein
VIEALAGAQLGVVTPQVLGEYWVATRRLTHPIPEAEAEARVRAYLRTMRLVPYEVPLVLETIRATRRYGFHYYDAQLWAAARLAHIPVLLTEDGPSGAEIEGVRFVDPFAKDFDLDAFMAG